MLQKNRSLKMMISLSQVGNGNISVSCFCTNVAVPNGRKKLNDGKITGNKTVVVLLIILLEL